MVPWWWILLKFVIPWLFSSTTSRLNVSLSANNIYIEYIIWQHLSDGHSWCPDGEPKSFLLRTDTTSVFDWNVSTTVIWIVVSYGGLAAVWLQNFTWLSISTSVCGWWLIFYFRVNRCAWIQPHKAASTAAAALILVNLVLDRQYRHTCWYRSFK